MTLFPDIDADEALELELQIAAATYLYGLEQRGILTYAHSVNEGERTEAERYKLTSMGMKTGHPDLDVYLPGGRTAFFELKTRKGWVFPAQKLRHALLRLFGFEVHVVKARTASDCVEQIATILRETYRIQEA